MSEITIITEKMLENSSSFASDVKPGDYVEEKIVENFLECVPPATHHVPARRPDAPKGRHLPKANVLSSNLIQCGEPYSSAWDESKQKYRATYITFSLNGSYWQYCGTCFLGETVHRNK